MGSVLPAAATYSKSPEFWGGDFHPRTLRPDVGPYVIGDDGQRYLSWVSGLGQSILGHAYPPFVKRIKPHLGSAGLDLPSYLEEPVAEKLCRYLGGRVPGWEPDDLQVRWVLGGSEACDGAVMLARAATGRRRVYSIGYHGWHPAFTGLTPPALGVVPDRFMTAVPYGDIDALTAAFDYGEHAAAVIIEQTPQNPPVDYWQMVRALCDAYGALLIIDEVVTAFRLALAGAAEYYQVPIDLGAYGKAISNGLPMGAIVGLRKYMRYFNPPSPVFVSATGAASLLGLSGVNAMLDLWGQENVDHIWRIGATLMDGLRASGYSVVGQPARFLVQHESNAHRGYFIRAMAQRRILANRPWFPCLAHTPADVAKTVKAAAEVKAEMATIDVTAVMAGKEPCVLFEGR